MFRSYWWIWNSSNISASGNSDKEKENVKVISPAADNDRDSNIKFTVYKCFYEVSTLIQTCHYGNGINPKYLFFLFGLKSAGMRIDTK